jgi:probable F420-dependent oxidoreductase
VKLGFFAPHIGPDASRAEIARACDVAEEGGADSLWAVDHIAIPFGFRAVYPYGTHRFGAERPLPWWDCLSVLAYLAARTERVQIGTGVLIGPYRHPLATAKAIATIDALSDGRVLFGVGVGWLRDEFVALQLDHFDDRGSVMDEQLEVMELAWTQERVRYDGRHYRFADVSVTPKPAQPGGPPVLIGGNSPAALRRAARYGDGWHALMLLPHEIVEHRARLQALAGNLGRAVELPTTVCLALHLTRDASVYPALDHQQRQAAVTGTPEQVVEQLVAYRDVGVEHVQLIVSADPTFGAMSPVDVMAFVLREVGPAVRDPGRQPA